jgi:pimeloyl-ACP methyl ester carboxylesterase
LLRGAGVRIDRLAVAGFSLGGLAAARIAATWTQQPPIRAIVLHDPAGISYLPLLNLAREYDLSERGLAAIRCDTRLLIVQSQSSVGHPNSGALAIWSHLPQVARYSVTGTPNRNFLRVPDDTSHQNRFPYLTLPSLHETSSALPLTSMDLHGYWLPLYRAVYEAFFAVPEDGVSALCNSSSTTGSCARTRYMGAWVMDGVPATPMQNAADLNLVEGLQDRCPW